MSSLTSFRWFVMIQASNASISGSSKSVFSATTVTQTEAVERAQYETGVSLSVDLPTHLNPWVTMIKQVAVLSMPRGNQASSWWTNSLRSSCLYKQQVTAKVLEVTSRSRPCRLLLDVCMESQYVEWCTKTNRKLKGIYSQGMATPILHGPNISRIHMSFLLLLTTCAN